MSGERDVVQSEHVCLRGELGNPTEVTKRKEHRYTGFTMERF